MSHEQTPAPGRWWTCCDRIEKARVNSFELELADLFKTEEKEHGAAYARLAFAHRAGGALFSAEVCGASADLCGRLQELTARLESLCADDDYLEAVDGHAS